MVVVVLVTVTVVMEIIAVVQVVRVTVTVVMGDGDDGNCDDGVAVTAIKYHLFARVSKESRWQEQSSQSRRQI